MRGTSVLIAALVGLAAAQDSTFSPLRPPSIPLAVKSPWMSTWLPAGSDGGIGNGGYLPGIWPQFWSGQNIGWAGLIRVDGVNYVWMGNPNGMTTLVTQTALEYTSTRSIFTMDVNGLVTMTVTFLSNVTPDDLLRSSLPYSYLDISVTSADGKAHQVQVYTDISGEWAAGNTDNVINWSYGSADSNIFPNNIPDSGPESVSTITQTQFGTLTEIPEWTTSYIKTPGTVPTGSVRASATHTTARPVFSPAAETSQYNSPNSGISYHQVFNADQAGGEYSNDNNQGDWGYWYYTTANVSGLTFQAGQDVQVRGNFANSGSLPDTVDTNFRAINEDWPVFGFARDFGDLTSSQNMLVMISHHQKNCVQFESGANTESDVPCLWNSYFGSDTDAAQFFYGDYGSACYLADKLDKQIQSDAEDVGGPQYAAIAALAVRQAFGSLEFTNTPENPYVFLEEISSDDNIQTVDVIFPFHPIAVYLNPNILKWLLEPLLVNTAAGNWPYAWAPHDLGKTFPNATGYSGNNNGGAANQEAQPVEESGNILIMSLVYAQRAKDLGFLGQYYNILKSWGGYLTQDEQALLPVSQTSTDDFAGSYPNETNLAIKGIVGLGCLAQIANLTGNYEDGANFSNIASSYLSQWIDFSNDTTANPPRFEFDYGDEGSWTLLYNLFGDAETGLGLVPQSVYDQQSNFYPTVFEKYGVLLDTRPDSEANQWTKTDWEMWVASMSSQSTFDKFVSTIFTWLNETTSNYPFTDFYNVQTGDNFGFRARPVVGAMFAPLALKSAPPKSHAFGN